MVRLQNERVVWEGDNIEVHFLVGEITKGAQLKAADAIARFRASLVNPQGELNRESQDALLRQLDALCAIEATKGIFLINKASGEKLRIAGEHSIEITEDEWYVLEYPPTREMMDNLPMSVVEEWHTKAANANSSFIRWLFPTRATKPLENSTET
jgi:hypothetical protein